MISKVVAKKPSTISNIPAKPLLWLVVASVFGIGSDMGLMVSTAQAKEIPIESGVYRPLYLSKNSPLVKVDKFKIDEVPVTNIQFYKFLKHNP